MGAKEIAMLFQQYYLFMVQISSRTDSIYYIEKCSLNCMHERVDIFTKFYLKVI